MPLTYLRRYALVALILLSSGCGFHLRGMIDLPRWLNNICVIDQTQSSRDLISLLNDQWRAYNIQTNDNPSLASYWLIVEQESTQQQITSISSSTTPRQYQLVYTVRFKLQRSNAEDILPSSEIVIARQVTINGNRILGSNEEEALLKKEMRQDAAIQIINRISRQPSGRSN